MLEPVSARSCRGNRRTRLTKGVSKHENDIICEATKTEEDGTDGPWSKRTRVQGDVD